MLVLTYRSIGIDSTHRSNSAAKLLRADLCSEFECTDIDVIDMMKGFFCRRI